MSEGKNQKAVLYAILAAVLYAINSPLSKLLLVEIPSVMMAALLYLGAGAGVAILRLIQKAAGRQSKELPLTKKELPYIFGMAALDVAAPILLMAGLKLTSAANVSLLNNFEIVATSIIASILFKEKISKRLCLAIVLVTISSILLSVENQNSFHFSVGSVFVLAACVCWGFENNCTRRMSSKDPLQIVVIKGFSSGTASLAIAIAANETSASVVFIIAALLLGFVTIGLGVSLYVYAQRGLGAAKTSTYYAVSPFIGAALSLVLFAEIPSVSFWLALVVMIVGTYFASTARRLNGISEEIPHVSSPLIR